MLYQSCCNNLVTGLIVPSSLLQFVNSLFQTCSNKFGTSSANTSCQQLVNRLVTTCLQVCSNLCVFTCVVYGCSNARNVREGISMLFLLWGTKEQRRKKKKKVGGFCLPNTRELVTDNSFCCMLEALQA